MEPSETERGRAWISNFALSEQVSAQLLLDSVEFVGQDEWRNGLTRLILKLGKTLQKTIALVPVRELAKGQSYYGSDRNAAPRLLLSGSFPGSEALAANIASSIRREKENAGPFVASPSLANLRAAKCRNILLMDDYCGSGTRILRFHEGFRRHKTIRSWMSYGLLDFHVVAYAMTPEARRRLSHKFGSEKVHTVRSSATFEDVLWTPDERRLIEEVCLKYAEKHDAFGFHETRGLVVFSHSVPNNLPYVLRRRQSPEWHPFFEGNAVPAELFPLFGQPRRELRVQEALRRLGQERLTTGAWKQQAAPFLREALLVLAAIRGKYRNISAISQLTKLAEMEVEEIVENCRQWGLIAKRSFHLTDAGNREIDHAKIIRLEYPKSLLKGSSQPYYPQQLRVGR